MNPFTYERPADLPTALALGARAGARYLGGGTNLVDLMRETIERPEMLVDVAGLSCAIETTDEGGLWIGGGVKNTAVAADRRVRERYPLLSSAILAGASAQIRNMATVAGNLMQRTRCLYFYDDAARCNKRTPGAGCDALEGFNRGHAILGGSTACVAVHPSDMAVALSALDARVTLESQRGVREIRLVDFHRLPGETPHIETALRPGELITGVTLPADGFAGLCLYRKVRDRASYAFALTSVAAALRVEDGVVTAARLALGGVAPKPWRALEAEAVLTGGPAVPSAFQGAADAALEGAAGLSGNAFKIDLARRLIADTLQKLAQAQETV